VFLKSVFQGLWFQGPRFRGLCFKGLCFRGVCVLEVCVFKPPIWNDLVQGSLGPMNLWPDWIHWFLWWILIWEIYNHEQKSWDKFALLALLSTGQTRIQLHLPNLTPHTMLRTTTCNFLWFSTLYRVGRGNSNAFSKGKQRFFQTSVVKHIQFFKLRKCPKDFCPRL